MGRPSRRTREVVEAICGLVRVEGLSDSAAGALAGVSTSSLSRWKQDDEDFALELGQARAFFELGCLRELRQARKRDGTRDWRALAWLLQNSASEGYRRPRAKRGASAEAGPLAAGENPSSSSPIPQPATFTAKEVERIVEERVHAVLGKMAEVNSAPARVAPADETNSAFIPEIPESPAPGAEGQGERCAPAREHANLPEIPESRPTPRLSRRERRIEERRAARKLAKVGKEAARAVA